MTTSDNPFNKSLEVAMQQALRHLNGLDSDRVSASADVATLRKQFDRALPEHGMPPEQAVAELARAVEGGITGSTSGRFFAWVIGGSLPSALAADWLASAWDQNAGIYATAPAAATAEEVVGRWLKELFELPSEASFALVTGCQMAHVTCLAAARHALLERLGWDVEQRGLSGAPAIRFLTSADHHATCDRAVRLLGLGLANIVSLPSDDQGRLPAAALEEVFAKDPDVPTVVLLQAGDLNLGTFDDFSSLIPIARRYNAWVHVDGAFGLWAVASPSKRHLAAGVEHADSWATDGHKWLNVPYDCGYAFVRDRAAHLASSSYRASYLWHYADARDEMDWNPEFSRRARGFPTFAALLQLGRSGVADLVDRSCTHAYSLVTRIGALEGAEVVWTPVINQGLVRFLAPGKGATDEDHDRYTDEVIARILADGEVFFGGVTRLGRRAMRVSVSNWRTNENDVERAVNAVARALRAELPVAKRTAR